MAGNEIMGEKGLGQSSSFDSIEKLVEKMSQNLDSALKEVDEVDSGRTLRQIK